MTENTDIAIDCTSRGEDVTPMEMGFIIIKIQILN